MNLSDLIGTTLSRRQGGLIILTSILLPWLGLVLHRRRNIIEHTKRANYYNRRPVPNAQGIWLWLTLIILIIIIGYQHLRQSSLWIYLGAITLLGLISTIDLFRPIPSWIRLLLQIVIFGWIVLVGGISINELRIGNSTDITLMTGISVIASIIRFGLCTNAINWFDGIQGQSSGVTTIGARSLLTVVSWIVIPSYETLTPDILTQLRIVQIVAFALGLVALIYTIIEYKPLGLIRDIGTTIYGFSLAYLALLGGAKIGILVVVLSLVIFDAIRVTLDRLLVRKVNPFRGDYTHFHHRLIANGRSRSEIRWFVRIWSSIMMVLMLLQGTQSLHKRIILIMMAMLFFGVNIYLFWIKKLPTEMKVDFKTEEVEGLE